MIISTWICVVSLGANPPDRVCNGSCQAGLCHCWTQVNHTCSAGGSKGREICNMHCATTDLTAHGVKPWQVVPCTQSAMCTALETGP